MPKLKGSPKSGGRKAGVPNKKTAVFKTVEELCKLHKIEPLEFFFRQMKMPLPKALKGKPPPTVQETAMVHQMRAKAAEVTLPYVRPRLAITEVRGPGPGGAHYNVNENTERIDPNDPGTYEAARRIAFVMAEGVRLAKLKAMEPPKG